jgi:hypothetical protein
MQSVAIMVEMMVALMVGEWEVLKVGSMVEPKAVMIVDDLDYELVQS